MKLERTLLPLGHQGSSPNKLLQSRLDEWQSQGPAKMQRNPHETADHQARTDAAELARKKTAAPRPANAKKCSPNGRAPTSENHFLLQAHKEQRSERFVADGRARNLEDMLTAPPTR